ncbi:MAG: DNA polymerase III subunit gamma/tau [Clostridia bacterium]|nr:DNA polymerase III subunit gamma/tau [Clostridia bacterium]
MYQVLYRKWRPKVFSDVVGQPHITSTLKNEIENGRHSHAYLFTGSRGTGKTTCAKILAKAVNCLNPVNGDPCNECEVCKKIDNGSIMDVVEIDAASNNGVENIRDIRQEVNFAPASCKYRVYIIDEVHMLSAGAFNALLKTLEEPPAHVKFILATTEVHKIPATILSRCQRFDFRRIPGEDMLERMSYIAAQEGIEIDRDAVMLISRISDGGMRDALSLMDQCAGRSNRITADLVSRVAGLTGKEYLFRLTDSLCASDCAGAMEILDELHSTSCDMERLCSEMINHFRSLMIVKTVRKAEELLVCTKEELELTVQQAEKHTLEGILNSIDLLQDALGNMKKGVNKRIEMEMAVIRLASPNLNSDNSALLKRIADLERIVRTGYASPERRGGTEGDGEVRSDVPEQIQNKPKAPVIQTEPEVSIPEATVKQPESAPADPEEETAEKAKEATKTEVPVQPETEPEKKPASPVRSDSEPAGHRVFDKWPEVIQEIRKTNMPLWGVLDNSTAYLHGDYVLIDCPFPAFNQTIREGSNATDVRKAIFTVTGEKYRLGIYKRKEETATQKKDPLDDLLNKMRQSEIKVEINE